MSWHGCEWPSRFGSPTKCGLTARSVATYVAWRKMRRFVCGIHERPARNRGWIIERLDGRPPAAPRG